MSEPWTEAGYDSAEAYIEALKAKEQTLSNQVKAKEEMIQKQGGELGEARKAVDAVAELEKKVQALETAPAPEPKTEPAPEPTPAPVAPDYDAQEREISRKLNQEAKDALKKVVEDMSDEEKEEVQNNPEFRVAVMKKFVEQEKPTGGLFKYLDKEAEVTELIDDKVSRLFDKYKPSGTNVQPTVKSGAVIGNTPQRESKVESATEPLIHVGGSIIEAVRQQSK